MKGARAAAENSIWVLVGRGLERIIRIAVVIVLARVLGVHGFGIYSFAFAFSEMFAIFSDAGLHPILVREIARDQERAPRLLGNAIFLKGVLAALSWVIACIIAVWTVPSGDQLFSTLVASFLLFVSFRVTSFRMIFDAPFEARLKMSIPVAIGIGSEILSAGCLIWAAIHLWSIPMLIAIQISTFLPGFLFLVWRSLREIRPVFQFDIPIWRHLMRMAIPVGLANIFLIAYARTDILMLGWMMDQVAVGMYSAAFKLIGSLTIIPAAITTTLLPLMANAFSQENKRKVCKLYQASLSVVFVVSLPLALCGYFFASEIIHLVYGDGYELASRVLQVLSVAIFFSFGLFVMTTSAVAIGRVGLFTAYAGILTLLNIALNAVLIPSYGIWGASVATLIAEGCLMLAGLIILKPFVGLPAVGTTLRAGGAAIFVGLILFFLPGHFLVRLLICSFLYLVLIYQGKGITSEGAAALSEMLYSTVRSRPSGNIKRCHDEV